MCRVNQNRICTPCMTVYLIKIIFTKYRTYTVYKWFWPTVVLNIRHAVYALGQCIALRGAQFNLCCNFQAQASVVNNHLFINKNDSRRFFQGLWKVRTSLSLVVCPHCTRTMAVCAKGG